jgi:hypothetical protein
LGEKMERMSSIGTIGEAVLKKEDEIRFLANKAYKIVKSGNAVIDFTKSIKELEKQINEKKSF